MVVKGGNAIDPEGRVGVLLASRDGGTVGQLLVRCRAAGSTVLAPVGLEKLVASVPAAARALGQDRITRSFGAPCGMMELVGAEPITEVHAFEALAGVEASHVASGGVAGSEGSVVLALAGPAAHVDRAVELAESARRRARKPAEPWKGPCEGCGFRCELRK